jgi:dipeptidyl aminopeptidase/acylaminoacyl peptidase
VITDPPGSAASVVVAGSGSNAVVSGLPAGGTFTFTVLATNAQGTGPNSNPSSALTLNALPATPSDLAQFEANGTTPLALGRTTDGTTVVLQGRVTDPDGGQVQLRVEVKPVGVAFDGSGLGTSASVTSGSVASVQVSGLSRGVSYHWRARALDALGATSAVWESFGGNPESGTDFRMEASIVFSSNRHGTNNANQQEIYSMDPNGSNAIRLTINTTVDTDPSVSPDGTKIAFQSNRDGDDEIYVMNLDGSGVVQLTTNSSADQAPVWSPDGSKIAFASNRISNGNYDVWTMNADGSSPVRLTTVAGTDTYPSWSPDGMKIAFASARDGDLEIFTMNANGTSQLQVTANKRTDSFPSWSPSGTTIVFSSNRDTQNNPDIYVMSPSGSSTVRLTTKAGDDTAPVWSRDGARILFQGIDTDNDWEIYRILSNGSGLSKITSNGRVDVAPSW